MFDRFRRTPPPEHRVERLKHQAAAALTGATATAGVAAGALKHQAKDAAGHAKEWAAPRVEKAWYESKRATAPKVEEAAAKALPVVDRTHDRLVDDVLPKLVAAVNAAAAAAAVGADRARDVASTRLGDLAHIQPEPPKKSHTGAKVFWSIAGLAVVGAVVALFKRSQPTTDPWAEEPWEEAENDLRARAAEARDGLGEAAEVVGEAAGGAVARTRDTSEKVAERARETARRSRASTTPAADADVTDTQALEVGDADAASTEGTDGGTRRSGRRAADGEGDTTV